MRFCSRSAKNLWKEIIEFSTFSQLSIYGVDVASAIQFLNVIAIGAEKLYPNFRQAHSIFLPSFLRHSKFLASFSSRQLSGPLSTPILISRILPSADTAGRFFRAAEGVRIIRRERYAPSSRIHGRGNAPIGYYVEVNDSICVHADCRNSRKLMRIRGRYPEGTKRKRIPGARAVCSIRKIPRRAVYLGPPISPQSGIFSQMRRLEQTPLRLSIKADSLM